MLPTPKPITPYCQPSNPRKHSGHSHENCVSPETTGPVHLSYLDNLNHLYPQVTGASQSEKIEKQNKVTNSSINRRASSLSYRSSDLTEPELTSSTSNKPNTKSKNSHHFAFSNCKKPYGISNSVSSHEIANTCTVSLEHNSNHKSIHSEFSNNHLNKISMFKPETSAYSPTGYSWIPQEKFGIRPQFLGLYQSNPMLNDQRNVLTNANQIHALHHSSSLSPDVTNTEDTSTNKLYSKKRHGTVTNKKNISVPTSFVCSRTPANNDYNSSMKGESFKAPMSKGYAYNHKRFGSRVASRENIQEPSPMKASNGRSSHTCDYNSMSNSRESNKYGISSVKNKERVHFQSDTPNQTSQTQSVSITSTRCLQGEEGKSKFVETEPNHTPQADDSYSEKNETYETVKKNIHMMQHFTKVNTLQNPIYPSIISHKNENLNISASLLNSANKNTPNKAANACSLSNTRNTTVQKSHQLRNTDEVTGSFDQHVNHENVSFSESIAGNQPQSVHSQVIQKQKTQQRHTLPNSNSATSSLSAGDDRAFCDSGISSSSYSKDSACTSPSDPSTCNLVPTTCVTDWVFNRTPCNKRPLHDQSPHQELNQESLSKIPSFSKQSDTSKNYNSTRIVDSEPSFSITQRPQRPRTIGKLISQTGNGVISLIPQTCEQDLQVPQKAIHDSYIPTVSFAKANLEVISPNKVLQSFRHSDEHSANTPDSPLVPTNTMVAKRPNKILVDPNKSKVKGAETEVTSTTNMFSTNTSSSINNTDTSRYNENSSNLNNLRSRVHLMSEPPKLIERLGHIQCDQRNQTPVGNTLNNRRQQNHHQQHQHVAGQAIDQRFKNKSNHLSFDSECENGRVKRDSGKSTILNNEQSMKIRFTQFTQHPDNSESDNKATLAHQQLSGSVISEVSNSVEKIPTTSNPIDFRKISENLENPFLWKSLSGQVTENPYDKPPDITSDPDILLSSLSKLSCDPCLEDNSWDQNYFSDVESEYAALELILPTTKRESLTEAEIALELDRKLSENTACSKPNQVSNGFTNCTNPSPSLVENLPYPGSSLEPGYFSDTEAIFSSQRKLRPLPGPTTFSTHTDNNCKLPIASVTPIMSPKPPVSNSTVSSDQNSLLTTQSPTVIDQRLPCYTWYPQRSRGISQNQETRWPRLCSLQNLVNDSKKDKLRHCINRQDEMNKAQISVSNFNVGTGPLSQVKLPYPTISLTANMGSLEDITVKSGISSFAVRRRGTFATVFNSDHYKMKMRLLTGEINGMISVINPSTSKSSNLLIENFRQETKRLRDGLSVLSAQLSLKDNAIEALEDNVENMTVRIEQLQALDNLKSSEIRELQSIISRLRGEDMNSKSLTSSPSHFQPRPPRSTSCRTLPDAIYQDIQDAISLSSFTSGTSAGSQDPSVHFQQQQQQKQQQRKIILKTEGKCSSRTGSSPTASDTERSNGKHSRWLRTSFSKAFRKRTKSNIHTNDQMTINDSTITNLQPNLQDQISMNSQKSGYEQELERLHLTVSQMRWQMDLLEARNKKLQEIILKHNPDEFAHKELCLESTERKVTLFDLISKYCQNACHIVQVFVNTASIHQRNFNQNSSTYQGDNYLNNNNTPTSAQLNCTKLFKIGCIGLHDEMTWDDMDKQLQKLFQHHIDFLDPHEQLRLHSLEPQAYQLNFMFTDQGEMKTQSIVRCFCLPSCSMSLSLPTSSTCSKIENQSQMTCALVLTPTTSMDREISSQSPAIWVNDIIKEHDAKTYTLSLQVHLKGCPMKFSLEKEHNIRHPTVVGNTDMLKYVCFGSLVPLNTLNSYLSLIQQNPVVIICGPSGTGKSHLVNDLTRLLIRDPFDVNAIYKFWFKNDGGTTLKEVKNTLNQQLASHAKYGFPEVINLFNIHHLKGSLLDILSLLNTSLKCPTIIGTSENGNDELEKACTNTHIKIINHLSDKKDAKEYLERSLYRKLAQYRLFTSFYSLCGSNEDRISMNTFVTQVEDKNLYYLIPWLSEFWNQLHEIPCSLTQKNHLNIFGLRTFLTCPMHSQVSLNWFLDLWNNMLVPILFKDAKQAITIVSLEENLSNMFKMLNNFLGWITTTWPWNPTGVNFPTSIKEPKITLTQNSLSMIKNYQLILSTSCNSDAEICKHRTSMDSGIILDGMYPTNSGISSSYENNTSTLCNNNNYYYPNSVTESQDVQQNAHNTHDCNQLVTMLYQLQHENQTTGSCSKTVSSID